MANYIQLFDRESGEPESLRVIDEKLCMALGVPCHAKKYYHFWANVIGYSGENTIDGIINSIIDDTEKFPDDDEVIRILTWIGKHYTLNAWFQR